MDMTSLAGFGDGLMVDGDDQPIKKQPNTLPIHGNKKTMNMNHLVLTNIVGSIYFKNRLYGLKTYHEVVDEIYYKVNHLEPWEKGSRKTAGQVGMCGSVRGVGAGGIVSSCFCLLFKLFSLKITRKQLKGLCNHIDSSYIRGVGFMYIRYTQPPEDFWEFFEPYLEDDEEIDVQAGGGRLMTIGELVRHFLVRLDWFGTLFPRIPVKLNKDLEKQLVQRPYNSSNRHQEEAEEIAPNGAENQFDDRGSTKHEAKHRDDHRYGDRKEDNYDRHGKTKGDSHDRTDRRKEDHHNDRHRDHSRKRSRSRERSSKHRHESSSGSRDFHRRHRDSYHSRDERRY